MASADKMNNSRNISIFEPHSSLLDIPASLFDIPASLIYSGLQEACMNE